MSGYWGSDGDRPERPADPAVRSANLRRIVRLFVPYRRRLGAVLALILLSSALGAVSPFLIREIFDEALPERDTALLNLLVGGLIAIAIVTGALGVLQTWLSNVVGQRVMHDLRAAVYRHLQRLSLAFFTRTRTGEVQSRIANDIGGITTTRQRTMADMSALVEESLSVSGVLLGKSMGRGDELAGRFERESSQLAELEVRQRMAGRWVMASIQTSFSVMPALVYWFAGQPFLGASISLGTVVAFTTLQTRLFFPVGSLLTVQIDVQTSLALFDRIFEYLDLPMEIRERPDAKPLPACRGDISFERVWFRYDPEGPWTLRDVSFEVASGTRTAIVGETGSGKTTLGYLAARLYDVERGRVLLDGIDVRDVTFASLAQTIGVV